MRIQSSMCLDEMVALEDHIEEVVMDVLAPTRVYTFICVEIKTNTETVAPRVFQKVQTTLVAEAQFFYFYGGEGVRRGAGGPIFFSSLPLFLTYNPMSL
jgi:hypothetical protein